MSLDRELWQVGCGDANRPYERFMFRHGVALIGPGTEGAWPDNRSAYEGRGDIRDFAETAQPGDLVVARRGLHQALGVGVLGNYGWSQSFEDIEGWGWDLQHYRHVRWLPPNQRRFKHTAFPRTRFSRCHDRAVQRWVGRIIDSAPSLKPPRDRQPPAAEQQLDPTSLKDKALESLVGEARWWLEKTWSGELGGIPSEGELLTHLTVPLLLGLGWQPRQIAIGWKYTDVAAFEPYPREEINCKIVVEGKRIGQGLYRAADQARGYVKGLSLAGALLVTTNGVNYRLHTPPDYREQSALWANLAWPKQSAVQFFDAVRPASASRSVRAAG